MCLLEQLSVCIRVAGGSHGYYRTSFRFILTNSLSKMELKQGISYYVLYSNHISDS